jgi:hypothetical protein
VARVVEGNDRGLSGTLSLGPGFAGSLPFAASVMNPAGGGVSAWPSADQHGNAAVAVREDFPNGAVQTALVSGGGGGPVSELAVGRSGLGDGLVAFLQGPLGNAAVVAAQVTAPPALFVVNVAHGWIKPSQAAISWVPAASANGPLRYQVVVDGRVRATRAGAFEVRIDPRGLGDGVHRVQVLATDADGQATLTPPSPLRLAGSPPTVTVTLARGGSQIMVRIRDAGPGVDRAGVSVSFGDGSRAAKKTVLRHRYGRAGIYRIVVRVRDKLGNAGVVSRLVSVR